MKAIGKNGAIIRSRNWFLVSYLTLEEITDYCKMGHISRYAFIYHDRDTFDHDVLDTEGNIVHKCGDLKEPHFHILVVYHNARTATAVKTDFQNRSANTLVEQCVELDSAFDYLTHKRNPEKAQYSLEEVVCDNLERWLSVSRGDEDNKAVQLIADILDGKNPVYMLKKYGRDFVLNHQRYYQFACDIGTLNEEDFERIQEKRRIEEEERKRYALTEFNGEETPPLDFEEFVVYDNDGFPLVPCYS